MAYAQGSTWVDGPQASTAAFRSVRAPCTSPLCSAVWPFACSSEGLPDGGPPAVSVGVAVAVSVAVAVGVAVAVAVSVAVGLGVEVWVAVAVGVWCGVAVGVCLAVWWW